MKNKLIDLNDHLFAQLERLSDEALTPEQIELEAKRSDAIVQIADKLIDSARTTLAAGRFGRNYDTAPAELKPVIMAVARLEHAAREKRG